MDIQKKTTHTRTTRAAFNRFQLTNLVAEAVAKAAGIRIDDIGVSYKVTFEDEREGSPAYTVGTGARVEIIEDLSPQPQKAA